jgi:hypothetical protein
MQIDFASEAALIEHYKAVRSRMPKAERRMHRKPETCIPESTLIQAGSHQWGPWFAPKEIPKPSWPPSKDGVVSIVAVKSAVRRRYSISEPDLISHRREQPHMRIRQIAMYLCCKLTGCSLPEIGRHFGNRDHTTILSNRDRIMRLRKTDQGLDLALQSMEAESQGGAKP